MYNTLQSEHFVKDITKHLIFNVGTISIYIAIRLQLFSIVPYLSYYLHCALFFIVALWRCKLLKMKFCSSEKFLCLYFLMIHSVIQVFLYMTLRKSWNITELLDFLLASSQPHNLNVPYKRNNLQLCVYLLQIICKTNHNTVAYACRGFSLRPVDLNIKFRNYMALCFGIGVSYFISVLITSCYFFSRFHYVHISATFPSWNIIIVLTTLTLQVIHSKLIVADHLARNRR
jgi:hypothetical protein